MERYRDGDDVGDGGGDATVSLSSDKMDLRSMCDSFLQCLSVCSGYNVNYILVPSQKFLGLT
jgi:hypothetical protein